MAAKDVDTLIEQGFNQLEDGEYKKALRAFNKVIKEAPGNPYGYFGKAEASVGDSRLSLMDVSQLYRKVLELEPENDYFLSTYADFCLSNGLMDKGAEIYGKVATLIPENAPAIYIDLAYSYASYGLLFLSRLPNKEKDDVYRESFDFLRRGFDMDEASVMEQLGKLTELESGITDGLLELPWEREIREREKEHVSNTPDLMDMEKKYRSSEDPLALIEVGQQFFYSGLSLTGESYYLRAIEMDEEMGRDVYNDLASLLYMTARDLYERGNIDKRFMEGMSLKSMYYSIRAMGISASGLKDILVKSPN